eukprot:5072225-Pleurochrysis_carterae.AAC.7
MPVQEKLSGRNWRCCLCLCPRTSLPCPQLTQDCVYATLTRASFIWRGEQIYVLSVVVGVTQVSILRRDRLCAVILNMGGLFNGKVSHSAPRRYGRGSSRRSELSRSTAHLSLSSEFVGVCLLIYTTCSAILRKMQAVP